MVKWLGIVAGFVMPFFNVPLIARIVRRKSSEDISWVWAVGAWVCVMGVLPSSLASTDLAYKVFGIVNAIFFTGVFITVLYYRPRTK